MSNLLQNESTYFFQPKKPRVNNPTYVSSGMTDSLVNLNPPNDYTKTLQKQTEYKQNFQPHFKQIQNLPYIRPSLYAKYSKAAFEKNKSMLSNYGATILRQSSKPNLLIPDSTTK